MISGVPSARQIRMIDPIKSKKMYRTHQKQNAPLVQSRYIMYPTDPGRRSACEHAIHPTDALSSIKISDTRSLAPYVPRMANKEIPSPDVGVSATRVHIPNEQPLDLSVKRPRLSHVQPRHNINNHVRHDSISTQDRTGLQERRYVHNSRESRKEIVTKESVQFATEAIQAQKALTLMLKHRQEKQQRARYLERDALRSAMISKVNQRATYDIQISRETVSKPISPGMNAVKIYNQDVSKYDMKRAQRLENQRSRGVKRPIYQASEPLENAKTKEFSPVRIALVAPRKKECTQNEKGRQSARERSDDLRIRNTGQPEIVRGRTFFPPVVSMNDMINQLPDSYQTSSAQMQAVLLQHMYSRARSSTDSSAFGLIHNSMAAGKKINKLLKSLNNEKSSRSDTTKFCVASRGGLKGIRRQQMEEIRPERIRDVDGSRSREVPEFNNATSSIQGSLMASPKAMYFKHLAHQRNEKERRVSHSQAMKISKNSTQNIENTESNDQLPDSANAGENRYQVVINKKHQPIKLSVTPPASNQVPVKTVSVKNLSVSTATSTHPSIQPAPASIIPKRMAEKRMRHGVHNRHRDETRTMLSASSPDYTHSPKAGTLPNAIQDYYYSKTHFRGSRTTDSDPLGEMIRAELERKVFSKSETSLKRDRLPSTEKDLNFSSHDKQISFSLNIEHVGMTLSDIARRDMLKKQFKLNCVETNGDRKQDVLEERYLEKLNNRRLNDDSLRSLPVEGLANPCKVSKVNSSPLTSPIADQPSPPMPVLTPQRVAHPDEERVRSGNSPIPVLKDARHEIPSTTTPLSPSPRHHHSEERFRSNLQHRFELLKPHTTPTKPTSLDKIKTSDSSMMVDTLYSTGKVDYRESVSQGTKEALQEIFREANDQVISYQMYCQMLNQNLKEDYSILSRLKKLREDVGSSGKDSSKQQMHVIDLTDSREASPSPVHPIQSNGGKSSVPSSACQQQLPVVEQGTKSVNESGDAKSSKNNLYTETYKESGSERLPHDSPFRKVYRGLKQRVIPASYPKPPSPVTQDKFTARFSDPNVLKLPKDVGKPNVVVAKTIWPSNSESERLTFTNVSEVRDLDDAVDYFGRSVPEQLEDVKLPAIRFQQSEDTSDNLEQNKHVGTPPVSPRRDGSNRLEFDGREQRLKNISPTVTTLTGETIIKPPRKRPLEVCRLANSEGFVAEKQGKRNEDLLTDSVSLDREGRALKRAIMEFNKMEAKERVPARRLGDGSESKTDTGNKCDDNDPEPDDTDDNDNVFSINDEERTDVHPDMKRSTILARRRTRNAGARLGSLQKPYNKNARYELEIEKEQAKYWQRRRQRSTSVSVSEDVEEDTPPAKRRPGRPKVDKERKTSTSSNRTAQILSEKIKMKYKGCGRGKYPRVRKISIDSKKSFDEDSENNNDPKIVSSEYDAETITEEIPLTMVERRKSSSSSAGKRSMRCVVDPRNPHKMKFVAISDGIRKVEEFTAAIPTGRKRKMKTKHLEDVEWADDRDSLYTEGDKELGKEDDVNKDDDETLDIQRPEPPPDFRKILANKKLGETILHRAAKLGYDDVAIYCVEYCILDINAKDNAGYTALHECCVHGRLTIAHKLLCHGADVNAGAVDGTRPIHDAVDNDHLEVVRLLLSFGADPLLATYSGRTTLKLARSKDVRTLIYGFLTDINGTWEMGEDEEPLTAQDLKWQFSGSCSIYDDRTDGAYNIFDDIPGPDSDTDDNLELELELSDTPHLNTFNIQVDETKGIRNFCLLSDVCQTVNIQREDFEAMHPTIHIVRVPGEDLVKSVRQSQIMTSCIDHVDTKDLCELVELNDDVRKLLDVEKIDLSL